jgi:tetratricopeptide (TPR) repeat protein
MGSFVRFLIDAYGVDRLKQVYTRGDFEAVYGKPAAVLAQEWEQHLSRLPVVARAAAPLVRRRFSVPSLFERRCPHFVPRYQRHYRAGGEALARGDTARAAAAYEAALALRPTYAAALDAWARLRLAQDDPGAVIARLDTLDAADRSTSLSLRLADALAVMGHARAAQEHYEAAYAGLPLYARESAAWLTARAALADHPEAVRVLVSGATPEEQARRLAAFQDGRPSVGLLRALLLAQAGAYEQAIALLRTTPAPRDDGLPLGRKLTLQRQRGVWLARYAHRNGDLQAAERYARQAARAYRNAGDYNAVAMMNDFAAEMQFLQRAARARP